MSCSCNLHTILPRYYLCLYCPLFKLSLESHCAKHKIKKMGDRIKGLILWRLNAFCGDLCIVAANLKVAAAMHEPQYTRWNVVHLMHCGSSCIPARGLRLLQLAGVGRFYLAAAPQYQPFYPFTENGLLILDMITGLFT